MSKPDDEFIIMEKYLHYWVGQCISYSEFSPSIDLWVSFVSVLLGFKQHQFMPHRFLGTSVATSTF
jgi:hypothetical protein